METTAPVPAGNEVPPSGYGESADKTKELTEQAREKLDEAKTTVQSQLKDQLDMRSTDAGDQVLSVAGALRRSAEDLRVEGKTTPARVLTEVSDRVEHAGGYLSSSNADQMLRDLEDFVYRRPLLVVAGAALAGFAAARFLGASSRRRREDYTPSRPELRTAPPAQLSAAPQQSVTDRPAVAPFGGVEEEGGPSRGLSTA